MSGSPGRSAVIVGVGINLTMAAIGGLLLSVHADDPEHAAAGLWPAAAVVCIISTPSVLAVLGLGRRPWLLVVSGGMLFPMCFLSFSFLFFPLFVPATIFLTVAALRLRPRPRPRGQWAAAVLGLCFVLASLASLRLHQDPVEWHTATESGSASDVTTMREALTSLGFVAAAVSIAALAPRDGAVVRQ